MERLDFKEELKEDFSGVVLFEMLKKFFKIVSFIFKGGKFNSVKKEFMVFFYSGILKLGMKSMFGKFLSVLVFFKEGEWSWSGKLSLGFFQQKFQLDGRYFSFFFSLVFLEGKGLGGIILNYSISSQIVSGFIGIIQIIGSNIVSVQLFQFQQ